jgi:uncharacterized protein
MERANLFCGAGPTDNEASNHLVLSDVKLPGFDKAMADHRPGGSPVAVEVPLMFNRLESTFQLLGLQPQVLTLVGSWKDSQNWFYIFGNIRDQLNGEEAQAIALLRGTLGRSDPQNWNGSSSMHTQYSIRSIIHYEFQVAGNDVYYWDFAENSLIIGDVNRNANMNANLGIAATAAAAVLGTSRGFTPGT